MQRWELIHGTRAELEERLNALEEGHLVEPCGTPHMTGTLADRFDRSGGPTFALLVRYTARGDMEARLVG